MNVSKETILSILLLLTFSIRLAQAQCTKGDCDNGQGVFTYTEQEYGKKSAGKYRGYFSGGIRSGKGNFIWDSGDKYQGEWFNGLPHGEGTATFKNGAVYQGQWIKGLAENYGVFTPNGTRHYKKLEGKWLHGGLNSEKLPLLACPEPAATASVKANEEKADVKVKIRHLELNQIENSGGKTTKNTSSEKAETKASLAENSKAEEAPPSESDSIGAYSPGIHELFNSLEADKSLLSERGFEIRAKIEAITDRLSLDKNIPESVRKGLQAEIVLLEQRLIENEKAYQDAQHQAFEALMKLKITLMEKDSLNAFTEAELARVQFEKDKQATAFRKKLLLATGVALVMLVAAVVFLVLAKKIQSQKKVLESTQGELMQSMEQISKQKDAIEAEKDKSDKLLLNILPAAIADELKSKGSATPRYYHKATVLFTDFKGFTKIATGMSPEEVVVNLDKCFTAFDAIIEKYGLEKIKTIGDSYMCAGGVPVPNATNPIDAVRAALEMVSFMDSWKKEKQAVGEEVWEIRVGLHTGELLAGVVGNKKFAYDIWGDTVNIASRMESSGEPGKVNISEATYELVKDSFEVDFRGKISAKGKGEVGMYFVKGEL